MSLSKLEKIAIGARSAVVFTSIYQAATVHDPVVTSFSIMAAGGAVGNIRYLYPMGVFSGVYSAGISAMNRNWTGVAMGIVQASSSAYLSVYEFAKR